jgi:hypothetical protein
MFDIFFKRKKIVVDAFTANVTAYDLFPIQKAVKFVPDWWKKVPPSYYDDEQGNGLAIRRASMKTCAGFLDLYKTGFILPLWSDLTIQSQGTEYQYQFADATSNVSFHSTEQIGPEFMKYMHVKLLSPWRIREKTGIQFLYSQPSWNEPQELMYHTTPPGIIEYKYQHTTNVNMFLTKGRRFDWSAGRPMAHIIPLTEHDVDLKVHCVGPTELMRVMTGAGFPFFMNGYMESKKILKNKCPYEIINKDIK